MLDANILNLYLFLWWHWEMISDLLFNNFLSVFSDISTFFLRYSLQRFQIGL